MAATAAGRVTVADVIPRLATEVVGILDRVTVAAGIQPLAVADHRMVEDRRRTEVAAVGLTADMGGKR